MSPITHGLIGWSISQPLIKKRDRTVITAASLLPDLDGLGALISVDYYSKYHHTFGHSIFFGVTLSLLSYFFCHEKKKSSLFIFLSFNSHILGDLLGSGSGWGIPYWWPLNKSIYEFTPPFQWALDSWQNLVVTLLVLIFIIFCALRKDRTILEVVSPKADKIVVKIFKKWFGFL